MRKVILLIFLIALLSGCIKPTTQVKEFRMCKDRLITLEDYSVSALSLSSGSTSLLKFIVRNNCDKEINVTIDFFDTSNLNISELECVGCEEKSINEKKINLKLAPFDVRAIHVILEPKLKVNSPLPSPVSFKINYTFTNNASATIPVIDGITVTRPKSKFKQNVLPSPVKLYFEPPVGGYRKEDNRIIKEYWITSSQQTFDITFKFRVLKPKRGELIPVKVKIKIEGINIEEVEQDKCSGKVIDLEKKKEVRCKFKVTGNAPAYPAILKVSYKFNYGFILTENFVILP